MSRIMIVEDDLSISNMLKEVLPRAGYEVICAYSGTEALLLLEKTRPDLILLDLMLPGLTGEEVLPKLKGIPVIITSAKSDTKSKIDMLTDGAADELNCEQTCLNDILEQSLAGSYAMLSEHGIVPDIEISAQPVMRQLDRQALRRIFDNILINAAKYSDGDLKIGLSPDGTVSFENSAKDLDAVQTAHLFDRFFTVNTARGGTGLGLSIAKLLTEKMGGIIAAQYRKGKLSICVLFQNS